MNMSKWQSQYSKTVKPTYEELLMFFPENVRRLFLRFNDEMNSVYQVFNNWQRYDKKAGWVYAYCRNYRCELLNVSIGDVCFYVLGVEVTDENSLAQALHKAKEAYGNGYEEKYASLVAKKKADQIQRTKIRVAREKEEMEKLKESIDPDKLNSFKWAPKVSRNKLIKLYKSEAQGLQDEELLDEVGYTFYSRCKQAKEVREGLDKGQLICHHCGNILYPTSYTSVVSCSCGYSYTYREYRRSCNSANMPGGRATPIFYKFIDKWPECRTFSQKMLLIDWLVHECHVSVMSGEKGRSVCVNLIEGTITQIKDMLEMLAGH